MTSTWAGPLAGYCADQRVRSGVTVVFVTGNYEDVFRSWCSQPGAPRQEEILLVACDRTPEDTWGREVMTVLAAPTDGSLAGLPADLAFSQGTIWPRVAVREWGFVLCCGFFSVRANQDMASFLESVNQRCAAMTKPDDQVALNTLLLEQDTVWDANGQVADWRDFRGEELCFFPAPVRGRCHAADLDLCLLPHHLFPRLGPVSPEVMVEHLLENKKRNKE